ncbi:MAG: galactose mutarotase [Bacteroidales bacterium]|nr:galactose mutarotase [Bacteroidales bacterium]
MKLIQKNNFEESIKDQHIDLFTLRNNNGLHTQITNFGGRVVSLWTPDREGNFEDIVLGFDSIQGYFKSNEKYFGALIGRCGNRIANSKFQLYGVDYNLEKNVDEDHLHGGPNGFHNVIWNAEMLDDQTLELKYCSADMEQGYPGELNVKVVYQLTDLNELRVEYWAQTSKPTIVNLTHHSFFNLTGAGNGTINNHLIQINSDFFTAVDQRIVPNGEIRSVSGTPLDFSKLTSIGSRIDEDFDQLKFAKGYDHNWVLNSGQQELNFAARVLEPRSGRILEVYTNEPGMQFYTGNFLNGSDVGKEGKVYDYRSAFCLETQHFPDAINQQEFPSVVLNPNEEYHSICVFKFKVE